jgi:4-hydroxy-2-oxoheptanedioate aldolase
MPNPMKDAWRAGRAVVNGWISIPSAFGAELMAKAGFDALTVDMQHGIQDYASAVACMQAIAAHPVVPMVRVPWNEPGIIGKVLDAGAMGVICPMVNSAAEARALVEACRYPPLGQRSFGPIRAAIYGQAGGYFATANDDVAVIAMIETKQALDNLEAILDVPGLDGVYIGPGDLGLSLGLPPMLDRKEPEVLAAYDRVLEQAGKRGMIVGIHNATPEYALTMVQRGFRFVTVCNDAATMATGAIRDVAVMRKG